MDGSKAVRKHTTVSVSVNTNCPRHVSGKWPLRVHCLAGAQEKPQNPVGGRIVVGHSLRQDAKYLNSTVYSKSYTLLGKMAEIALHAPVHSFLFAAGRSR